MRQLVILLLAVLTTPCCWAQSGGELRLALRGDPKTLNPILVEDSASESVRYLTGGVLIRVNRETQELQPELAKSWKLSKDGRGITFLLRSGIRFSDDTPFDAEDVAYTMKGLMDPGVHSATGDAFRSGAGNVKTITVKKDSITIVFPEPVAGLDRLFDQVAIMSSRSPLKEKAVLGPFVFAKQAPGSYLLLKRNPNYWKKDDQGRRLPYLDSVRLDIVANRENEILRFRRGELHMIREMPPDIFERVQKEIPSAARDLGPALESEQMWFNQVPDTKMPAYKRAWFNSANFRRAFSASIQRTDIARLAYLNHAEPAAGPVSRANRFWFNQSLQPLMYDPPLALKLLQEDGFQKRGAVLYDRENHPVEFSLIMAGGKARERTASLIQQDVAQIGIKLNLVTLDLLSVVERVSKSYDYEACLLALGNVDLDPNNVMNLWLSSGENHQWNPKQKTPATPWEAEVDRLMRLQASTMDRNKRKAAFDQVQKIVVEQQPFLYLVYRNGLVGISPQVQNVRPSVLSPQTFWNVEYLALGPESMGLHL